MSAETMTGALGASLWPRRGVAMLVAADAVGLGALTLSWVGASGEVDVHRQSGWLAAATAALAVGILANLAGVVLGRQRIQRTVRAMRQRAERCLDREAVPATGHDPDGWLVVDERSRYLHRAGCPLVTGKTVQTATAMHHENGHQPCGVCTS